VSHETTTTVAIALALATLRCGSFEGGGAISFGRLPTSPTVPALQYTPLRENRVHPTYYVVTTDTWEVGGQTIATAGDFNVGYGTVMDSGTTFTYVPTKVFHAFAAELAKQVAGVLEKTPGPDPSYPQDVCYYREGSAQDTLGEHYPTLALTFGGGARLELPPSNYLFIHGKRAGAFCLGIMDNFSSGTLIGGITVRNTMVEYDMEGGTPRIGMATTNCDALLREHAAGGGAGANAGAEAGAGDGVGDGVGAGAGGTGATAASGAPGAPGATGATGGADFSGGGAPEPASGIDGGVNATWNDGSGVGTGDNATTVPAGVATEVAFPDDDVDVRPSPAPAGFIVLLFFSFCLGASYVYVRYFRKKAATSLSTSSSPPLGLGAMVRRAFGGGQETRYAHFGLDDAEERKRPGEVELPPLLSRGGAAHRSTSPPKTDGND